MERTQSTIVKSIGDRRHRPVRAREAQAGAEGTRRAATYHFQGRRLEILAALGKDSLMESYLWTIHRFHREHEPPGRA